jgi:NTP pyrophosphatase (non-canonical NTP hydrolase)
MSYPSYDLTFSQFQERNKRRCREGFDKDLHTVEFFAIAIAGEAGELCNKIKKVMRGDVTMDEQRQEILKEVADVITYCDLLMSKLGAETDVELMRKFNEVSERRGLKDHIYL